MENWNIELSRQYPKLTLSDCPKLFYFQFLDSDGHLSLESLKKSIKFEMFQLSGELTSPSTNPQNDVIYQVAHYIRLNYAKPFSQFSCAQLFFINKNYMCRKFKNTFHTSMVSYLNQIRIDHAKDFLKPRELRLKMWQIWLVLKTKNTFPGNFTRIPDFLPMSTGLNSYQKQKLINHS